MSKSARKQILEELSKSKKSNDLGKLEELEKALKEYKEALEKQMGGMQTGMPPGTAGGGSAVNTTMSAEVEKKEGKKLDSVGEEDEDINNDGKVDETDSYLKNRRKKISQAMGKGEDCEDKIEEKIEEHEEEKHSAKGHKKEHDKIKDMKKYSEIVKFEKNGQWSLEKAKVDQGLSVDQKKQARLDRNYRSGGEIGVHKPIFRDQGVSSAGMSARAGDVKQAKKMHADTLKDAKSIGSPIGTGKGNAPSTKTRQ